nr:hypothetical protein [Tanacetum cinerariifolium]
MPKESTFQIALDAFSLTHVYQAFLISANVPAIYMHELWATVSSHNPYIKFKLNTKNYSFDLETFRDMLQICPNLPGQKFLDPSFEEEILAFIRKLGHSGDIKALPVLERRFQNQSISGSGKWLRQMAQVMEDEQMKIATKRSKTQFHNSHANGSGDGVDTQSKVPDEQQQKVTADNEEEEEKADDDVSFDHRVYTPPDYQLTSKDENQEGDDEAKESEEEQEEEEELYGDLNIIQQRSDAEMTDAQQENVQVNQVTEYNHVTLTTVHPAVQQQSSSISSDLVSKFINPSPDIASSLILGIVDNYLASKMKDVVDVVVQLETNKLREEA